MLQCPNGRRSWAISRFLLCAATFASAFGHLAIASDVTAPIEQLDAGLLQVMKAGKGAPFQQRYDILAPLVTRAVDLDSILQDGVGPGWASLPPAQQMALKAAFQRYSIATYVSHFDDFAGERFDLYPPAAGANHDPERPRKLLVHRRELERLMSKTRERGLTVVPTRLYFKGPNAKVELALARGKDVHDKRETIRRREQQREVDRALRDAQR